MEKNQDKAGIAGLIELRLRERYIDPLEGSMAKNGFASMALACLLIETLQNFRKGLADTKGKSKQMFRDFFAQDAGLREFKPVAERFYYDVRCGLMHQGEAQNGWTIMRFRGEPLFDRNSRRVHATRFLRRVHKSIEIIVPNCGQLIGEARFGKCRRKMNAIMNNCTNTKAV